MGMEQFLGNMANPAIKAASTLEANAIPNLAQQTAALAQKGIARQTARQGAAQTMGEAPTSGMENFQRNFKRFGNEGFSNPATMGAMAAGVSAIPFIGKPMAELMQPQVANPYNEQQMVQQYRGNPWQ